MAEFRHIVRVAGVDLPGEKRVSNALQKIGGVSVSFANALMKQANIGEKKAGDLADEEVSALEAVLKDPHGHGIPHWMFNRQKDFDTGNDAHILGVGLAMIKREDVGRLQKTKTYRGVRHALGLRVRGQRTRSSGRKGSTVGVKRKGAPMQRTDKKSK